MTCPSLWIPGLIKERPLRVRWQGQGRLVSRAPQCFAHVSDAGLPMDEQPRGLRKHRQQAYPDFVDQVHVPMETTAAAAHSPMEAGLLPRLAEHFLARDPGDGNVSASVRQQVHPLARDAGETAAFRGDVIIPHVSGPSGMPLHGAALPTGEIPPQIPRPRNDYQCGLWMAVPCIVLLRPLM